MNYKSKSNDSFNSRLRFYLFKVALASTVIRKEEFLAFDIDVDPHREHVDGNAMLGTNAEPTAFGCARCVVSARSRASSGENTRRKSWPSPAEPLIGDCARRLASTRRVAAAGQACSEALHFSDA